MDLYSILLAAMADRAESPNDDWVVIGSPTPTQKKKMLRAHNLFEEAHSLAESVRRELQSEHQTEVQVNLKTGEYAMRRGDANERGLDFVRMVKEPAE